MTEEPVEADQLYDGMYLIEQVVLTTAIVISQSCDAERAPSLMMAPVSGFAPDDRKASGKWKKINNAATSLNETKLVYLPGNPTLGLTRSTANFGDAFTVPRLLLEELEKKGKRKASLGEKAVAYLQFRFGVMLTRVAQDDYAWPSCEDIDLKIECFREEQGKVQKKLEKAKKDLQEAEASNAEEEMLDDFRAEVQEQQDEFDALTQDIKVAEAARAGADEVEKG